MQQQKPKAVSLELSPHTAAEASELIREGKANLEVVVYPWGVEFALSSPCCPVENTGGGSE